MATRPIRWLHLSDFHVGRENYPQISMFKKILDEIEKRTKKGAPPDIIFITGDIANKGKDEEYKHFTEGFLEPLLLNILIDFKVDIFAVPGNHDVNRDEADAVQKHNVLDKIPAFLDPGAEGLLKRKPLLPRFFSYQHNDPSTRIDREWIASPPGTYTYVIEIEGIRLGILGLNTAWLSEDEHDKEKLTPGTNIVETGLEKIKDTSLKIVLGHHPTNWFRPEDANTIRTLFGKNQVVYLHGHLHEIRSVYEDGGQLFRSIQAGAAFQVRPDDKVKIKKNRILWCELDPYSKLIKAEPLQWHDEHKEWKPDTEAFHNRFYIAGEDKWALPLQPGGPVDILPPGWKIIDGAFLAEERAHPLTIDAILRYFDGRLPLWSHALCPLIPKRAIVHKLKDIFQELYDKKEPQGILLVGPGGEGKSTVLMQTVCELVDSGYWQVLWHEDPESPLPADFYTSLEAGELSWLIASDDADLIAQDLLPAIKSLREAGRSGIHFLLCARKTDWHGVDGHKLALEMHGALKEVPLRGITQEDATVIVKAWSECGEEGLGKLAGLATDEAAKNLVQAATSDTYAQDGAFLGAMLQTRYGDMLKDHIKDLLGRLQKRKAPGGTLMRAFAYIVALHAENKHILTKTVLAQALKCEARDILPRVIGPLGDEAAFASTGRYILTRHRVIAEAARDILTNSFYMDFDEIYIDIIRSAQELRVNGQYVHLLNEYEDVCLHFINKDRVDIGVRLAEVQVEANPKFPFLRARLSSIYRRAGQPDLAVEVFRTAPQEMQRDRAFYYEWGTAEGNIGNQGISAWLDGISIADDTESYPPDNNQTKQSLAGLGVVMEGLYDQYGERTFIESLGAIAQLGFKLILDETTKKYFLKHQATSHQEGVTEVEDALALERVIKGIVLAGEKSGATLPFYVPRPETLTFEGLKSLLKLKPGFPKAKLISLPKDQ